MKKINKVIAAFSIAALSVSCAKELTPEIIVDDSVKLTKCTLTVGIDPETKVNLEGTTPSWVAGDQIAIFQYGRYKASATKKSEFNRDATKNVFTARTTGSNVFDGTIANFHMKDTSGDSTPYNNEKSQANSFYIFYPSSAVNSYTITNGYTYLTVPGTQTGKAEDVANYAVFNGKIDETDNISYDEGTNTLTITGTTNLKCLCPILKFSVPESLGATRIDICGRKEGGFAALSGMFKIRGSGSKDDFVPAASDSVITIFRGGEVIKGEVYAAIAPTSMTGTRVLANDATSVAFKVYNADGGKVQFVGSFKGNGLKNNIINSVGSLPSSAVYTTEIPTEVKFLKSTTPTVSLCDTIPGSTFYYTCGIDSCPDPTVSSTQFFAETGFPVNISALSDNSSVCKILIHTPASGDKTVSCLVRNYTFNSAGAIATLTSKIPAGGTTKVNDFSVYNKSTSDVTFESFLANYITASSSLYMSVPVMNKSRISVLVNAASNSASSQRPFKVFKSDDLTAAAGLVQPAIYDVALKTTKGAFPHNAGAANAGDSLTFWANGGTNLFSFTILEAAETITVVPTAPETISLSTDFSDVGLPTSKAASIKGGQLNFTLGGYPFYFWTELVDDSNYIYYYYSSSLLTIAVSGTVTDNSCYIKIPAIPGYSLSEVKFKTSAKSKHGYVLAAKSSTATQLGHVTIPSGGSTDYYTISLTNPGDLNEYYFRITNKSSIYMSAFVVNYSKKPE